MVNFGVVAVARVTGAGLDQLLELRCECGTPGCRERVRVGANLYAAVTEAELLVVSSPHALGAAEQGDRWFAVLQREDGREDRGGADPFAAAAPLGDVSF